MAPGIGWYARLVDQNHDLSSSLREKSCWSHQEFFFIFLSSNRPHRLRLYLVKKKFRFRVEGIGGYVFVVCVCKGVWWLTRAIRFVTHPDDGIVVPSSGDH